MLTFVLVVAACGDSSDPADTTEAPTTTEASQPTLAPRPTGTDTKMSSQLYSARLLANDGVAFDGIASAVPELQFDDNGVLVEVTLDVVDDDTTAAVAAAGLVVSNEFPDLLMINGSIAPADLSELAELDSVVSIAAAFGFTNN